MKKLISIILCFFAMITLFPPCSKCDNNDDNYVEYPEMYTYKYCSEHYVLADPNLHHKISASNGIHSDSEGSAEVYYAIKGIPIDEYLLYCLPFVLGTTYEVYKNKYNSELPTIEILSYKIKSILVYAPGRKISASMDGSEITAFQDYFANCVETENYISLPAHLNYESSGSVHVIFEKYENLIWESSLIKMDDAYYIFINIPADEDGKWTTYLMQVNQKVEELVESLDDNS